MGTIYTLVILILWLLLVPTLIGIIPASMLPDRRRSWAVTFIAGYLLSLAVFELVAIPCMLLITYSAFSICCRICSCQSRFKSFCCSMAILSCSKFAISCPKTGRKRRIIAKKSKRKDLFCMNLIFLLYLSSAK